MDVLSACTSNFTPEEVIWSHETTVIDGCKQPGAHWELNSGPLSHRATSPAIFFPYISLYTIPLLLIPENSHFLSQVPAGPQAFSTHLCSYSKFHFFPQVILLKFDLAIGLIEKWSIRSWERVYQFVWYVSPLTLVCDFSDRCSAVL